MMGENVQGSMFKVKCCRHLGYHASIGRFPGDNFHFNKFIILLSLLND